MQMVKLWVYTEKLIYRMIITIKEKFYFTPGNSGFKVWDTKYAKIGVGICWDQWFPETARKYGSYGG